MLLCGLYSFKTPEGVRLQRFNRTVSIVDDTIINSDGEESQCQTEVVVEGNKSGCTCTLEVANSFDGSSWTLRVYYESCGSNTTASAECRWIEEYPDKDPDTLTGFIPLLTNGNNNTVASGSYTERICKPYSIKAWACEGYYKPNQNK